MMPLKSGYSEKTLHANIAQLQRDGYGVKQAYAIAVTKARSAYLKRFPHGLPPYHLMTPEERAHRAKMKYGPKPNPAKRGAVDARIRAASKLYKEFSGHEAESAEMIDVPDLPEVGLAIGKCLGLLYETVRDGEREQYIHRFKKSARPLLVSSFDGRQLYLLGGAYRFTERGIVDDK